MIVDEDNVSIMGFIMAGLSLQHFLVFIKSSDLS